MKTLLTSLALLVTACGASSTAPDAGSSDASADASDGQIAPDAGDAAATDSGADAETPVVSVPMQGCPMDGYWTTVTLGGSQSYVGLIETSDGTSAFASATCTTCTADGVSPLVTIAPPAVDQKTTTSESFGGGSSWSGEVYADTVGVGAAPSATRKVAAITSEKTFFSASAPCDGSQGNYGGTLGLGTAALASGTDPYVGSWASENFPDVVAVESCELGGTMWLGGFDTTAASGPADYTPLAQGADGDEVSLAAIQVAATTVTGGTLAHVLVSTNLTGISLPTAAYNAAVQRIDTAFQPTFGKSYGPNVCVTATTTDLAALPSLTLVFPDMASGTISVTVPASQSYLQKSGSEYCAMLFNGGSIAWVSASAMRARIAIFDRASSRLGLAPQTTCP